MFALSVLTNLVEKQEAKEQEIRELETKLLAANRAKKELNSQIAQTKAISCKGQKALEQVKFFLMVAEEYGNQELIDCFWSEIDEIRQEQQNKPIALLEPAAEEIEPTTEEPELVIDPEYGHVVDTETEALIEEIDNNTKCKKEIIQEAIETGTEQEVTNPKRPLDTQDLYNLTLKQQKRLLKYHGKRPGKNKAENAWLLAGIPLTLGRIEEYLGVKLYPQLTDRLNTLKVA